MRRLWYVVVRLLLASFCWLTALYAFVASSVFAYQQFIRPRVFGWVGEFADWHARVSWVWVALLIAVLWRDVRGRTRTSAALLLALAAAAAIWNSLGPLVATLADGTRSVVAGGVVLAPVVWLAALDHQRAASWLLAPRPRPDEPTRRASEGRLLVAALGAALLVAVTYAVLGSVRLALAFEPELTGASLAVAVGIAVADLLFVFTGAFVLLATVGRLAGQSFALHYAGILGLATLGVAAAFSSVLRSALSIDSGTAWIAGLVAGVSVALTWGGLRLRRVADSGESPADAVDMLFPCAEGPAASRQAVFGWVAIVPLAYLLAALSARMDWDFVVLKAGVLIVWVASFLAVCRAAPRRPVANLAMSAVCAAPLLLHAAIGSASPTRHALDRYAVYNASFLVADAVVRPQPQAPSFDRYLRHHTGLTDVTVAPISIDLVPPPLPMATRRPLIFLLVIDSLRTDYLSPYNEAVRFTPRIQQFADSNLRFANAFTRYGGTGLSMPAIWAGSALAHKQYVRPFAPMNSLEKLLDRNGYQRVMSRDHITETLWQRRESDRDLDHGRPEMDFDFCRTLDEMGAALSADAAGPPLFVQTRSLNLHVASVRNGYVPPGKVYEGFEAPYAWRVERMDACFGEFVDRLKRLDLYDRSLIVLTSDHGELIGEDGRWGHSYHMFPEVVQIPLLVHLPASVPAGSLDVEAVSLSTDIVPTIYRALGYQPARTDDLAGWPLIGIEETQSSARRAGSYVLAASYGAVYAVVSRNGRHLYIADAIKGGDYAYRRNADRAWTELTVDSGQRAAGQRQIRRHVDEVARRYGLDRPF